MCLMLLQRSIMVCVFVCLFVILFLQMWAYFYNQLVTFLHEHAHTFAFNTR